MIDGFFVKEKYSSALSANLGAKSFLACKMIRIKKSVCSHEKADSPTVDGFQKIKKVRQQEIHAAGAFLEASAPKGVTNQGKDFVKGSHLIKK